jgi:hypothetical protein
VALLYRTAADAAMICIKMAMFADACGQAVAP